uniref:Predicted protein n=1 Tax=Hordeum vulgare subsp. vulgare TaxID=112509 RepID=F2EDD8_HORVV|nr:predicted protein [Hordeum vulgare subsp. vulgare]
MAPNLDKPSRVVAQPVPDLHGGLALTSLSHPWHLPCKNTATESLRKK